MRLFADEEIKRLSNAQATFHKNISDLSDLEYRKEMERLGVDRNIRHHRIRITGTNYRPLEVESQIREALEDSCKLINSKDNVFEKTLLTLVLLSYIQAFTDGNKLSDAGTRSGRFPSEVSVKHHSEPGNNL